MADQITSEEFADHMDAFEQRLGARASRSDRRLETIDSRLDAIDGRLDTIDARLDVIDGHLRGISEQLSSRDACGVETAIDSPQPVLFPTARLATDRNDPRLPGDDRATSTDSQGQRQQGEGRAWRDARGGKTRASSRPDVRYRVA